MPRNLQVRQARGGDPGILALQPRCREWYECSLQRCLSPYAGSTIRAMALLPLSRMHVEGMELVDMDGKCGEVREVLERGELHTEHFQSVLEARTWQEMLEIVVRRERELFPYMYR